MKKNTSDPKLPEVKEKASEGKLDKTFNLSQLTKILMKL